MNKSRAKNIKHIGFFLWFFGFFLCIWPLPSALSQNNRPVLDGLTMVLDATPAVEEDNAMYGPLTAQALLSGV